VKLRAVLTAPRLRAVLTAPPFAGALVVVGLAVWAGRRGTADDADLGDLRRAEAVESFVAHRFASEITRMQVAIVATAIALGLLLGLVAELLVRVRYSRTELAQRPIWRAFLENALVCFAIEAALMLWAMADSPQLYAARWYAMGGLARTVQIFATNVLGRYGVIALAMLAAVIYARPARIVALARRAPRLAMGLSLAAAALALSFSLSLSFAWRPAAGGLGRGRGDGSGPELSAAPPAAPAAPGSPAGGRGRGDGSGPELSAAPPAARAAAASRPNILVIAVDSLRADHLDPRVAPALSALASRGTSFEHAYVSIPRTFPSWVTLLTGRHAHHHGIRSMFPTWEERARDFDALPQRLARAGYATGVVSDFAGDIFGRIELGFGSVETPTFDFRQLIRQRALERETPLLPVLHSQLGRMVFPVMRELNDGADPMLLAGDVASALHVLRAGATKEKPFFLTVFFSTAHFPYAAPAPYYAKYTDPAYRGRFKYHKPVGLGADAPPDAADITQIRALYDGAVSAVDDAAARILAALESEGLAGDTIVVVTADHGETLYESGHGAGHGDHLFGDEGTHVPLVVYDPRIAQAAGAARHVTRIARDVDLAPTLYALAGIAPPGDLDGTSLVPELTGGAAAQRYAYAESELWFTEEIAGIAPELRMPYPGIFALTEIDGRHNAEIVMRRDMLGITRMARHRMVRDERWKLVYVPTRKGVKYMLFDTVADPAEVSDVGASHPEELARLKTELWAWMLRDPAMEQRDGYLVPRQGGGTP
jgi:arylsulfatase A-like enzyme